MSSFLDRPRFFGREERSAERWSALLSGGREWESFYRRRWQHDRVVRSTHGVNCTGSCSWKIYVKDGIVAWETQQTDYPSNGADEPEYEPRGCPRGASFSWYLYSPIRVRYPYVRGALVEMWREAMAATGDPVEAWASIVEDPEKARAYKSLRGKGGFVRSSWDEVTEIMAAAHVYTIAQYGPDRVVGFTPIPAMSMVSYAAGTRFLSLIGGISLSFYDWYADLPPASPQVWGDQTDVPESADWWNAGYVILWGSNIPQTRTPDAHFMTEARYRGQKVVVVSPDFAGHTKFADHWLPAAAGSDGALALAMTHVIFKEFHLDREVPYFRDYAKKTTDLPCLVRLRERDGAYVADRFLRASDLGEVSENADWKTVVLDVSSGSAAVPNGSIGFRWGNEGIGKWNLELEEIDPALTLLGHHDELVEIDLPRFDVAGEGGGVLRRGVPAKHIGDQLVTTVFDLYAAQLGLRREGLPGEWPTGYDDPAPYTPAWQEAVTGVDAGVVIRIAREFARNAERTNGRSMIMLGAGTNHWFHSDQIYRAILSMLILTGCQGVNGGGWAHYVGQEKVRPISGWSTVAFGLDWQRPPRQQATTPFWFLMSDQFRFQRTGADHFSTQLGNGSLDGMHLADCYALAARLGWMPSYPTFDRNPLEITATAEAEGLDVKDYVVRELQSGGLRFAAEDPDGPGNWPRVLTLWRANLLGSSSKGHEYFLRHILGVENDAIRNEEAPPECRPRDVVWRDEAPVGKFDLFTTIDFRMNGSALYSDIVLPAATWYEKHDLSSTDLHPFVHSFNEAVPPPWETKTDFEIFGRIAKKFSRLAEKHLGVRQDLVAAPLLHDTPGELAQPFGEVRDWQKGECEPVPGLTMPNLVTIERDYADVWEKWRRLGPLAEQLGSSVKGVPLLPDMEVEELGRRNGLIDGRPSLARDVHVCETILALSGVSNGRLAHEGFKGLEQRTGTKLSDISEEHRDVRITFADTQVQPRRVLASPEWSGMESRERRYSPFTINIERSVPFRTLTGRQQFYVDHAWMLDMGEGLPIYRPPVDVVATVGDQGSGDPSRKEVHLRWLSPHSKWSIHSEFQDNLHMLTLFRGGPVVWIGVGDAAKIEVADNDWVEVFNRNGVITARAVISHRVPEGVAMMYHSQDRHVNVPRSELSGTRGGTDNSVTRISMKPTHLVGGYAQLSYGFNYYGPTGSQRDEVVVVRKLLGEVTY